MKELLPYILTFVGGVIASTLSFVAAEHQTKAKRKEADEKRSEEQQKKLDELGKALNQRLDVFEEKHNKNMNDLFNMVSDIKATCQESIAVTTVKLDALEEKQDKHNAVIERTFKLEERATLLEEKVKVANHRIEDLESKK